MEMTLVEQWIRHALSPFVGHPLDGMVRQAILMNVRTVLLAGAQAHPEMAKLRCAVQHSKDRSEFRLRFLAPDEDAAADEILIDTERGAPPEELQQRISYVYTAIVNAVATMTPSDRREILRGVLDCIEQYWPDEWKHLLDAKRS